MRSGPAGSRFRPVAGSRNNPRRKALWTRWEIGNQGPQMKNYEIRVMPEPPSGAVIHPSSHIDDHAAVRRAMSLAKPGQAVEVWCEARCVYSGMPPAPAVQ